MNARILMIPTAAIMLVLPAAPRPQAAGERVKLEGYAEWRQDDVLIVDGQRVLASAATRFKGKNVRDLDSVPLGYEVKVEGQRIENGAVVASRIEAKPNGTALFETDVKKATDEIESIWLRDGAMFEPRDGGGRQEIGKILESGATVDRVRHIMGRLRPPYVEVDRLRVRLVDTKEWNAAAMGNGAIWVYSGLADEASDDELAIVLGHELAHFTHEHTRRNAKKAMWAQIAAAAAVGAAEAIDSEKARAVTQLAAMLTLTAWMTEYSRDLEDQADRVGLRYTHEAGYDVTRGPLLWARFRNKYGERDKVTNFFFGSHSRPSDRIRNLERELQLNYRDAAPSGR